MPRKATTILTVLLLFAAGVWWVSKDYRPGPKEGGLAPDFTLLNSQAKKVSLSDSKGKVVLLNFWATTCPPCVAEMGSLERLYLSFQGKPFELLAVSLDEGGWPAIETFLKKIPVTFPILLDPDFKVPDEYGTYRLPESYLIDSKGKIVEKIAGPQEWAEERWRKKIETLLPL